jgi:anti-anti-sigma factor
MTVQLQVTDSGYALSGRLDNQRTQAVFQALPVANSEITALDLNELERVDSAGLALLVLWSNRQKVAGGSLHLSNIPLQTRQMMDILGLNDIL